MITKERKMAKLLNIILNCTVVVGIVLTIIALSNVIGSSKNSIHLLELGLLVIGITCLFLIIFNLKKVVSTLIDGTPFVRKNVVSFKNISIECFVISGCYLVNNIINLMNSNFRLVYIDSLGIHTDIEFALFLFAGLFILVLSQVFDKAVSYKEETDFMV
ncbi:DUF2975 domain-containing protein [Clostridium sp.]|uniref:DUF2975 domain-containing protein n=1 Tax=Clostridium sp. TaxID=1506 RepID=UPI003F40A204